MNRGQTMRSRLPLAILIAAFTCFPVAAREIHYGAVSDAELARCDTLHWRGRTSESRTCYGQVLQSSAPAGVRAEAAWALDDLQLANDLFRVAAAAAPDDAALRVRWADLFADSHHEGEAMNLYREALEIDSDHAFAFLGAAKVLAGSFDGAANTYLEPLLSDATRDAGARAGASLLMAQMLLEAGDRPGAIASLDTAAALIESHEWPPLELYALRAAADLLNNVTDSRYTALSLEYNPAYGGIYATPAHFYVITRRYREAIDMYQKAVDTEPGLSRAHEQLGINLLRDNQMSRARKHLEIAYEQDPFSPQAVNTLRLMDSFEQFRLISDPQVPEPGVVPILLRLHEDEAPVIAPYAVQLARESIAEFTSRYGFTLAEPVVIEMYPDHEDFAVRTAGMPGIGILGATFGYLLAMDSPSARPAQEFQWGTVLWHELAHVFTLKATGHLVPRWFSEGISVFEEWRSGPNPGVRIPMSVYQAMKEDKFLPVAGLDEGFIRPTYEQQVIVSYMQAGLICQFIDETFGVVKLKELLQAFGEGLLTAPAVRRVFDMSPAAFDRRFDEFIDERHGPVLATLGNWQQSHESLLQNIAAEDWPATVELAEQMIGMMPQYVEADSPYIALAKASEALGQREWAISTLEDFWRNGGYDPATLKQLATWLDEAGRRGTAIEVMQSVNLVDPFDLDLHGALGDLMIEENRAAEALIEYTVALALEPHDRATAHYRMAKAHSALGDRQASQEQLLLALEVAPNYRPAQRLLLELQRGAGNGQNPR